MNHPTISTRAMRTLMALALMSTAVAAFGGDNDVKRLSEPVSVTETHEFFGATLPEGGTPLSLGDVIAENDRYQDQQILLQTRIAKVCQKKGCFFVAQDGANTARVSFKDYDFFIPTDSGGKDVLLQGVYSRKDVSQAEAEHYAEDLGEAAPENPERFEYSIVATAVKIPRS